MPESDTESNVCLIDDVVLQRMESEGTIVPCVTCTSTGDSKMNGARSHAGEELELPFKKPNRFALLKMLAQSFQGCVVPIVNIVLVAHFTPSEYMKSTSYSGKTFGFVFMATTPIVLYAISASINVEYTCRRYLYYRLMEQGYLVDFKNPDLRHSKLFYFVGIYFFVMLRMARGAWFSVLMNCVSLCMCWHGSLQFENNLVSVNKFVESKDGKFDKDSFKKSAEFLSNLHYVSETRLMRNSLDPLEKPANPQGKYDLVAIAASRKHKQGSRTPRPTGFEATVKKAWAYRYFSQRHENFVDEQDQKFSQLAQRLAQGSTAFGIGLFVYLFLVGIF